MTAKPSVDLASFDTLQEAQETGTRVVIDLPNGEASGITITVAGPDSKVAKAAQRRLIDERVRKGRLKRLKAVEIEKEVLRSLASRVISWEGVMVSGEVLACTPENVEMVFTRYPFIREQVEADAGDRAAFLES